MTDEEMQNYIDEMLEYDDEELLETIDASEAEFKNGKIIEPHGPTGPQLEAYICACRDEAKRRGLEIDPAPGKELCDGCGEVKRICCSEVSATNIEGEILHDLTLCKDCCVSCPESLGEQVKRLNRIWEHQAAQKEIEND